MTEGFLLTRQSKDKADGIELSFWVYTSRGPILVKQPQQTSVFFIEHKHIDLALSLCAPLLKEHKHLALKSFDQAPVSAFYFASQASHRKAAKLLRENHIQALEYDVRVVDRYLMERFITADVLLENLQASLTGQDYRGRLVSPKHPNAHKTPAPSTAVFKPAFIPTFNIVSFDIETNYRNNDILSIAVYTRNEQLVFMLAEFETSETLGNMEIRYLNHEKKILQAFIDWVLQADPDILIGWNCINFDLRILQQACDKAGIEFGIGRNAEQPEWRSSPSNPNHFFTLVPGRAVLDGIDTLKSATFNFESFSLEFVAREVLKTGKLIHNPDDRAEEILRQFNEDKLSLARYNLEDCRLVWEIFDQCKLVDFVIERARLTGLPLDKVGGSVMAFENQYLPRLHRQGYVAPNIPENPIGVGSPGGYVMDSKPGIYQNVLVLDFKSLYPSIIRSFKIDPYGLAEGDRALINEKQEHLRSNPDDIDLSQLPIDKSCFVKGFRGAVFQKDGNILADLIAQLWQARDRAKQSNQEALSQAIKIIMNSFYGVMGTPGCRFFDRRLPSSITLRGHQIMNQTRELIESFGYDVIYGDTDSIFVHISQNIEHDQAIRIGNDIANSVNAWWARTLASEFALESYLELEFESYFSRFLMPTIRGSDKGSKKRYAGLITQPDFQLLNPRESDYELVFKGLETVRTDWTQLARVFQRELFRRVFLNMEYEQFIRDTVDRLRAGEYDEKLAFRKRLRRKLSDYQSNVPPHAQAAKKADQVRIKEGKPQRYLHGGWVRYFYTLNGPETDEYLLSRLDYDLYLERQIIPIVDSILCFFDQSFDAICSDQLKLL